MKRNRLKRRKTNVERLWKAKGYRYAIGRMGTIGSRTPFPKRGWRWELYKNKKDAVRWYKHYNESMKIPKRDLKFKRL